MWQTRKIQFRSTNEQRKIASEGGKASGEARPRKKSVAAGRIYMEREFLKDLGLADDVMEKVMAENGKSINKLKLATEASKTTLADLRAANTQAKIDYDANLKKLMLGSKIDVALLGAKAKNTKAVRALLDESKISLICT